MGPTAEQQMEADINQKMYDYYKREYQPLVLKYTSKVTSPEIVEAEKKQVTGKINADVMKNVAPASATNAVTNQKKMMNLADIKADAEVKGKAGVRARQIGEKQNLINMGRGDVTRAMSGLDELAAISGESAVRNKELDMEIDASKVNTIGSAVGTLAGIAYGAKGDSGSDITKDLDTDTVNNLNSIKKYGEKWGLNY